ncbi:MAG: ABC transporter ATP-binding protein [Candidatus Margulisiibacteriota bacterium]|jgi:putative ABC transport system ATP-binding protein
MNILKLEKINKIYKQGKFIETQALKDISLEIKTHDFVVISGPSGSGKTTLLNIIGALDTPSSGKIIFNEQNLANLKEKKLAELRLEHMGFIFQAYNLVPVLTAQENIEYMMVLKKVDAKVRKARIAKIAARLGIEELLKKKPNELSGGQQQRVAIARAIVSEPKLILADEPTANLDSKNAENLIELMKTLNEEDKITFIFSTHDSNLINIAKHNIILKDGEIFQETKK